MTTSDREVARPDGWQWTHERNADLIRRDGLMCEQHPGLEFDHDGCAGPGMAWVIEGKEAFTQALTTARREQAERAKAEVWALVLPLAHGCFDYGGGYRSDDEKLAIYHHGIQTVINVLESAAKNGLSDTQVAAVYRVGEGAIRAGAKEGK